MNDDLSLLLNSSTTRSARPWPRRWAANWSSPAPARARPRVLVHRIAWLIQAEHASPYSILSVTFTNKRRRRCATASSSCSGSIRRACGSAPSTASPIASLRAHWREAGLSENFQILDSDDQQRLVKRVIRRTRPRRAALAGAPGPVVHQRAEGRGPAAATHPARRRPGSSPPC
ncbi:UvrD-helicase domain-containing protein [Pseudomonas aeruginosa]